MANQITDAMELANGIVELVKKNKELSIEVQEWKSKQLLGKEEITEEKLIEMGFKISIIGYYCLDLDSTGYYYIAINKNDLTDITLCKGRGNIKLSNIKYIHQLQNLYSILETKH